MDEEPLGLIMIILDENIFLTRKDRPCSERLSYVRQQTNRPLPADIWSFGYGYFDDPSNGYAYSGYYYDGRYRPVAERILHKYQLKPTSSILEIGCAKGFLLKEFIDMGIKVCGIDFSHYAVGNAHPAICNYVFQGDCSESSSLPIHEKFDLVIAKEVLPHLDINQIRRTLSNCKVWAQDPTNVLLQIQVVQNHYQASKVKQFDPTHKTLMDTHGWLTLLQQCEFKGSVHFKRLFQDD
jgi:cyclopropane fatty-acyl-phospholipid synthase-like methyltransferase